MKPEKMQTIAEVASVLGLKRKGCGHCCGVVRRGEPPCPKCGGAAAEAPKEKKRKAKTPEPVAVEPAPGTGLILYDVTDEQIAELRARFAGLTRADDRESYEAVRLAIGETRDLRVAVEEKRKELKAGALEYGRRVDDVARRYREALEGIEAPLKALKAAEDEKKAAAKAAAEAAELARVEAEIKARREAEEAELRRQREAEEARLEEQRQALAAQQAEVERIRAEAEAVLAKAAEAKAEAERAQAEAEHAAQVEKARAEAAEQERARAASEALRVESERRAEELRAAEHAKLLEKLRPDAQRLADYATALLAVPPPKVRSEQARAALGDALDRLARIQDALTTGFGGAK